MIVTIHQPEHLIWLGLVDKISQADIFVILDTVQFEKNYFQNRNKIRTNTNEGWKWLTVSVVKKSFDTKIKDMEISYNDDWTKKYLNILRESYKKAEFFSNYYPKIEGLILEKNKYLTDLNFKLIKFVLESFGVSDKKIIRSSEMDLPEIKGGTEVNLSICKKLSAETYLSGRSGKDYLDTKPFSYNNIKVIFHEFNHPEYKQLYEPFIPYMSSIDLLFNYGPEAKDILWSRK